MRIPIIAIHEHEAREINFSLDFFAGSQIFYSEKFEDTHLVASPVSPSPIPG